MVEIIFSVKKQVDGTYIAYPLHDRIGGATDAKDYNSLKNRIREFLRVALSGGYANEIGLSESPRIKLVYSELLRKGLKGTPNDPSVITGILGDCGYEVINNLLNLKIVHENLDVLLETIKGHLAPLGEESIHQDKDIEFNLEEVIDLEPSVV